MAPTPDRIESDVFGATGTIAPYRADVAIPFHPPIPTKQSHAPMKPFYQLAQTLGNTGRVSLPQSTMEFDHVGLHLQPDLPPILQKLSGRNAKAAGVGVVTACPLLSTVPFDFGA
jgi:hypothetical protein